MQSEYHVGDLQSGMKKKRCHYKGSGRYKGMIGGIGHIGTTPLLAVTDAYPSLI